jgi:hypothetical protein
MVITMGPIHFDVVGARTPPLGESRAGHDRGDPRRATNRLAQPDATQRKRHDEFGDEKRLDHRQRAEVQRQ